MLSYCTNSLPYFSFFHILTYFLYALISVRLFEHFNVIAFYKLNIVNIITYFVRLDSVFVSGLRIEAHQNRGNLLFLVCF